MIILEDRSSKLGLVMTRSARFCGLSIFSACILLPSCHIVEVMFQIWLYICMRTGRDFKSAQFDQVRGEVEDSGGNLGGARGRPPPPPLRKMTNFRKFWLKRGLKTAFSSANEGICRKFECFVGNLGGFAPPTPEKVNFRHWSRIGLQSLTI